MESWRHVWRAGFAPVLPTAGLEALAEALRTDDATLLQGSTTRPAPLACVAEWRCEGGCLVSFCGWRGEGLVQVGDVDDWFAAKCFQADQLCGEPHACRHLLNWFDDSPRDVMRAELLAEVELVLSQRRAAA